MSHAFAPVAATVAPTGAVRFVVRAEASPSLLPRLLQPFAKRDLTPDDMRSRRLGEILRVEIELDAPPDGVVHLIEGNLRQVVGVIEVARAAAAGDFREVA